MAADRALWAGLYRDLEIALRPVRLDFDSSLDLTPAGRILAPIPLFQRGVFLLPLPARVRARFRRSRKRIRDDPPPELVCQTLDPWLDQVALPS
jgi:hypothetical protein